LGALARQKPRSLSERFGKINQLAAGELRGQMPELSATFTLIYSVILYLSAFISALFAAISVTAVAKHTLGQIALSFIAFIGVFLWVRGLVIGAIDNAHEKKVLEEYIRRQYGDPPSH
jgi:hypothetical protein